jgi:uncharacterized membrane protein (DUF2068 family)
MRPLGVTLIGLYQILRGILGMLFALGILLFSDLATKLASLAAEGNALERVLHNLGHIAGLAVLVFAFLHVAAGFGVLNVQNWGRLLTLLFCAVGLMLVLPGLAHRHVFSAVFGLINGASIIYLAMPAVKRIFQGGKPALRMAA